MGVNDNFGRDKMTLADSTRTFLGAPIEILDGEFIPVNPKNTKLITETFSLLPHRDPDVENNVLDEQFFKKAIDKKGRIRAPEKLDKVPWHTNLRCRILSYFRKSVPHA